MKVSEVSKRYAKALLTLTQQKGTQVKTLVELKAVAEGFTGAAEVKAYFENPTIGSEQKVTTIKTALSGKNLSEDVLNTLQLLAEKGRLNNLTQMVEAFSQALDAEQGITRGTARSATVLSHEAKAELEAKIQKVLNKKIILTYQEDPKILGGVIAQVGGWTFDDSIETHLKKLNEELNRRAN